MNAAPKHSPFQSNYRPDFEVLEERHGKTRLYPHTDQLPLLLRALNIEFYGALPDHIARTDKRGDGFHKNLLKTAATLFCSCTNAARPDALRLMALPDGDLVHKVAIVQQITEDTRGGPVHRFRFYAGNGFMPDIHLSGKRLTFADHVLQRFSTRVPNNVGTDLSNFLLVFYGTPVVSMPVGPGRAFVFTYHESMLAFTYKEHDGEFFVTTCLTINEINSMELELPVEVLSLHYGAAFTKPRIRNWMPVDWMLKLRECWERKIPLPPPHSLANVRDWPKTASRVKDIEIKQGFGPGSRLVFLDDIPGPCVLTAKPDQTEMAFDERDFYKKLDPAFDWDALFTEREKQGL